MQFIFDIGLKAYEGIYKDDKDIIPVPRQQTKLHEDRSKNSRQTKKIMLWLSGIQSWPVGQAVKTTPSHGVNPGSIPGQVISYPSSEQKSMKIAEGDFHGFLPVAVNVWTVTPNLLKEWGKNSNPLTFKQNWDII